MNAADLDFDDVVAKVRDEYCRATAKFGSFRSSHEGYAIILEELDELWDGVKNNDGRNMREEVIQVAAMAIRFYVDLLYDGFTEKQENVNESAD